MPSGSPSRKPCQLVTGLTNYPMQRPGIHRGTQRHRRIAQVPREVPPVAVAQAAKPPGKKRPTPAPRQAPMRETVRDLVIRQKAAIPAVTTAEAEMRQHRQHHHQSMMSDRKSTRLNSSHVSISYADLCLKKKN